MTIGPGITVHGQNGAIGYSSAYGGPQNISVVNQGTVSCDVNGGTITMNAQPFANQGLIQGTNGGTASLSGTLTPSESGTFDGAVSVVGTIQGGTVETLNGSSLILNSGAVLDGTTINGNLAAGDTVTGPEVTVTNGLVLNGTLLVGNPTNTWYGVVDFAGTQTLGGNGTVVFGDYSTYNSLRLTVAATTLTIGPGITIRGQNGKIGYNNSWGGPQNISIINQGTISCDVSGGTIALYAQPTDNQGLMQGTNGGTTSLSGTLTPSASGTFNGAVSVAGTIQGGTVELLNGSSLILNSGAVLDGTTINGNLAAGDTVNGPEVTVTNGLVLNGTLLVGNPTNN